MLQVELDGDATPPLDGPEDGLGDGLGDGLKELKDGF